MADQDGILIEAEGAVLCATFQRGEKKNALTQAMYHGLADGLAELEQNPALRCLLIRATGDTFCAGNDISDFLRRQEDQEDQETPPAHRFLRGISRARKPIIAAVQGQAIGIGLTMLLHCDLVYASSEASFSAPFVPLGLIPEAGSSLLLPNRIGHVLSMEIFLLGRQLSAAEALRYGIINAIFDGPQLATMSRDIAGRVAALSPQAVRTTKALCRHLDEREEVLNRRIEQELRQFAHSLKSEEAQEALRAFAEKRPADFSRFE